MTAAEDDLLLGGVSVAACLAKVRSGDHWHDNLVRLTGHWISRGWSDAEILTLAESLTLAGYSVEQTRREVGADDRGRPAQVAHAQPGAAARRRSAAAAAGSRTGSSTCTSPCCRAGAGCSAARCCAAS